jgi:aldose 1-epimerase
MRQAFGTLANGAAIEAFTLESGGLRAEILSYGGILRSLSLPLNGRRRELVLGLPDLAGYERDPTYLGCIIGRYANRIAKSRFQLDGHSWQLKANEGFTHLHGGALGFGKRAWQAIDAECGEQPRLRLYYRSPAGEEGYPGDLHVTAEFALGARSLELEFTARCDAATPISLTYHPYFNLAGDPAVAATEQCLQVPAETFLPVNRALLPTGIQVPVAGSSLDFRHSRSLAEGLRQGHPQLDFAGGYDHCLVLPAGDGERQVAELHSPHSGIRMRVFSNAPALQLYDGHGLRRHHPLLGGGVCLEPQQFPDAMNQPGFPVSILRPGAVYSHRIRYCFDDEGRRG